MAETLLFFNGQAVILTNDTSGTILHQSTHDNSLVSLTPSEEISPSVGDHEPKLDEYNGRNDTNSKYQNAVSSGAVTVPAAVNIEALCTQVQTSQRVTDASLTNYGAHLKENDASLNKNIALSHQYLHLSSSCSEQGSVQAKIDQETRIPEEASRNRLVSSLATKISDVKSESQTAGFTLQSSQAEVVSRANIVEPSMASSEKQTLLAIVQGEDGQTQTIELTQEQAQQFGLSIEMNRTGTQGSAQNLQTLYQQHDTDEGDKIIESFGSVEPLSVAGVTALQESTPSNEPIGNPSISQDEPLVLIPEYNEDGTISLLHIGGSAESITLDPESVERLGLAITTRGVSVHNGSDSNSSLKTPNNSNFTDKIVYQESIKPEGRVMLNQGCQNNSSGSLYHVEQSEKVAADLSGGTSNPLSEDIGLQESGMKKMEWKTLGSKIANSSYNTEQTGMPSSSVIDSSECDVAMKPVPVHNHVSDEMSVMTSASVDTNPDPSPLLPLTSACSSVAYAENLRNSELNGAPIIKFSAPVGLNSLEESKDESIILPTNDKRSTGTLTIRVSTGTNLNSQSSSLLQSNAGVAKGKLSKPNVTSVIYNSMKGNSENDSGTLSHSVGTNKPLGSSENPIQLVQQGNTFQALQPLQEKQLQQITALLQQHKFTTPFAKDHNEIFDPETNMRIVYKVVYPEETLGNEKSSKRGKKKQTKKEKENQRKRKIFGVEDSSLMTETQLKEEKEERKRQISRTRSGRISRPPRHIVRDYKRLHPVDYEQLDLDDSLGGYSDYEVLEDIKFEKTEPEFIEIQRQRKRLLPASTRLRYTCPTCNKLYMGPMRIERHYAKFPDHRKIKSEADAAAAVGSLSYSSLKAISMAATSTPELELDHVNKTSKDPPLEGELTSGKSILSPTPGTQASETNPEPSLPQENKTSTQLIEERNNLASESKITFKFGQDKKEVESSENALVNKVVSTITSGGPTTIVQTQPTSNDHLIPRTIDTSLTHTGHSFLVESGHGETMALKQDDHLQKENSKINMKSSKESTKSSAESSRLWHLMCNQAYAMSLEQKRLSGDSREEGNQDTAEPVVFWKHVFSMVEGLMTNVQLSLAKYFHMDEDTKRALNIVSSEPQSLPHKKGLKPQSLLDNSLRSAQAQSLVGESVSSCQNNSAPKRTTDMIEVTRKFSAWTGCAEGLYHVNGIPGLGRSQDNSTELHISDLVKGYIQGKKDEDSLSSSSQLHDEPPSKKSKSCDIQKTGDIIPSNIKVKPNVEVLADIKKPYTMNQSISYSSQFPQLSPPLPSILSSFTSSNADLLKVGKNALSDVSTSNLTPFTFACGIPASNPSTCSIASPITTTLSLPVTSTNSCDIGVSSVSCLSSRNSSTFGINVSSPITSGITGSNTTTIGIREINTNTNIVDSSASTSSLVNNSASVNTLVDNNASASNIIDSSGCAKGLRDSSLGTSGLVSSNVRTCGLSTNNNGMCGIAVSNSSTCSLSSSNTNIDDTAVRNTTCDTGVHSNSTCGMSLSSTSVPSTSMQVPTFSLCSLSPFDTPSSKPILHASHLFLSPTNIPPTTLSSNCSMPPVNCNAVSSPVIGINDLGTVKANEADLGNAVMVKVGQTNTISNSGQISNSSQTETSNTPVNHMTLGDLDITADDLPRLLSEGTTGDNGSGDTTEPTKLMEISGDSADLSEMLLKLQEATGMIPTDMCESGSVSNSGAVDSTQFAIPTLSPSLTSPISLSTLHTSPAILSSFGQHPGKSNQVTSTQANQGLSTQCLTTQSLKQRVSTIYVGSGVRENANSSINNSFTCATSGSNMDDTLQEAVAHTNPQTVTSQNFMPSDPTSTSHSLKASDFTVNAETIKEKCEEAKLSQAEAKRLESIEASREIVHTSNCRMPLLTSFKEALAYVVPYQEKTASLLQQESIKDSGQ
ncbi:uncharacterized protein LOC143020894 isoform X2 [Oratosquilla oratoria]|uniref:uncharacterized protein LOC143020894 isoform X2 n=1 Tax=Oratosquilla oratoria TaxID=337810 RepID=UPI003F758685